MALNDAGKNIALDAVAAAITHLGLANNVIGSGSAGELSGGSPAYARKAATWGAAASGSVALTGSYAFDIPPAETVRRATFHSALTAGTYYGDGELTDETYAGQGTYTLTGGTLSITG